MEFACELIYPQSHSIRWSAIGWKSSAMKISTPSPRRTSSPFVATALAQSRERYRKSIGEARLMVGTPSA